MPLDSSAAERGARRVHCPIAYSHHSPPRVRRARRVQRGRSDGLPAARADEQLQERGDYNTCANLPRRAGERLRSGAAWRAARRVLERRRHSVSHRHRSSRATERESRPCYERPKDGELPSCASRAVVAAATTAPRVEYRSLLHMILFDARRVGERRRCSGTEGGRAPGPSASAPTQRASTSEQGRCSWHARRAMSVLII